MERTGMIRNLVYLCCLLPLTILFNELKKLDEVTVFDLTYISRGGVISLEDMIGEVEKQRA
jgi:hypothetical protein